MQNKSRLELDDYEAVSAQNLVSLPYLRRKKFFHFQLVHMYVTNLLLTEFLPLFQ